MQPDHVLDLAALRYVHPWPGSDEDRPQVWLPGGGRQRLRFLPQIDPSDSMRALALAAAAVVVITGLRALASYWQTIGFAQIGNRVLRQGASHGFGGALRLLRGHRCRDSDRLRHDWHVSPLD